MLQILITILIVVNIILQYGLHKIKLWDEYKKGYNQGVADTEKFYKNINR